jgi:hypothetical protein
MKAENVQPSTSAIVERFTAVLYPFPMDRLLDSLPGQGWIVPFGDRDEDGLKLTGPVSKGNVKLVFDLNLKTFGARGIDPAETLAEFVAIRGFASERFGLGPEVASYFTEFRFVGTADIGPSSPKAVPQMLERWWAGHARSDELGRAMAKWLPGPELGAYGVRMATKGLDANRPDWSELTIAPSATSGTRLYNFDLLYRNHDRQQVESVASSARDVVLAAIEELER